MQEQTRIVGSEGHLVATFTPAATIPGNPVPVVALLSNSGVIPRSGPHRINVLLARALADMGIASVRFDMSGLGDSQRSNHTRSVTEQWVADTRDVMNAAQAQFGCDRFFMVGLCSGAIIGHLVALEDPRMRAVLLWDMYAYPTLQSRLRKLAFKIGRAGLAGSTRKAAVMALRALRLVPPDDTPEKPKGEMSVSPPKDEFMARVDTLTAQGVELLFAYCGGQPEWFNHRGQFAAMFRGQPWLPRVAFELLETTDHLITSGPAKQAFIDMTTRWVEHRVLPANRKG
ncbi:MAG: alpha/beta hydrolase [Hydrogenophaga sp.]|uniref:serine aminopeptidase domain-containing protein n=1 Tax=Hydrogenophaga sp. TaxID=1904254 RepID=UPI001D70E89B|nr:alpha/beta hydrolase [Hydrogenophaga sp.]MBX3611481.1 alpha/beta hydrolase [Hydrogenophaga sp.]